VGAVVIGQASAALATPATVPVVEVAVGQALAPVLHGTSTDAGSGVHAMHFYARTVGAATWDLLNDVAVAGADAYQQLPAGRLSIGQAFEYQIADCDASGCAPSAVTTGYVSPALGAGERPGETRVPFTLGDTMLAQVDAGSGNLLITTTLFSLPRRSGSTLDVGLAFNSVTLRTGGNFGGSIAHGWRLSTGSDIRLRPKAQGAFVYYGVNGLTGTFFPDGAGGWTAPVGLKLTLAAEGGGWMLTDHDTGEVQHFDGGGQLTKITDRAGNATTFGYAAAAVLSSIHTDAGGPGASTLAVSTASAGSNPITGLTQTPDGGGAARSATLSYDPVTGFLTGITDTLGRTTSFTYGANNNLNQITAPGGAVTSFTYDAAGRIKTVTQPTADPNANAVTRFVYDTGQTLIADANSDQTVSVSSAAHTTYQLTTDGYMLVASVTDPAGNTTATTYSSQLDVATTVDPTGHTVTAEHAANNGESLTSVTSPTGATDTLSYGNAGTAQFEQSSTTDPQGNTGSYTYDAAGNPLSATDENNLTLKATRNPDGTVASITSPSGAVTSYGYNTLGQQTSQSPAASSGLGQRTAIYDGFGRLASLTSGRGITTSYSYDAGGRVTQVVYSDGTPPVTYSYNDAGQLATRVDATGTTSYGYDPLGRLTSRANTANGTASVSYSYDKAGNLATATNAAGATTYSYDSRELVTSMTTPKIGTPGATRLINFANDANGRRTDTWFNTNAGNTAYAAHSHTDYDASGRVTRIWTAQNSNDTARVSDLSYSYASPGTGSCPTAPPAGTDTSLRWSQTDNLTGKVTSYCYDHSNRLLSAATAGGDSYSYSYDADGNRTQVTKNGTTVQSLTFNPADVITTAGYTVDADGNLTADSYGSETYDGADRRTSITDSAGTHASTYAGTDQVEQITDGANRNYTYGRTDGNGLPLIESYVDGSATYSYVYDPQGTPLAIEGGNTHYLALDGLGSVLATINHSGTTTATYTYDPYGQTTATAQNGSGIVSFQLYGYAGGLPDRVTGIEHLGHRWYDPRTGRFTQQDPSGLEYNAYLYSSADPVNRSDGLGLLSGGREKYGYWIGFNQFDQNVLSNAWLTFMIGGLICAIPGVGAVLCGIVGLVVGIAVSYIHRGGVCRNGRTLYWYDVRGGSTFTCGTTRPNPR
jgi:RHS repeat-associated protein